MTEVVFSIVSHGHYNFLCKLLDSIDDYVFAEDIDLKIVITRIKKIHALTHQSDLRF